jgi:hypothetical protein
VKNKKKKAAPKRKSAAKRELTEQVLKKIKGGVGGEGGFRAGEGSRR